MAHSTDIREHPVRTRVLLFCCTLDEASRPIETVRDEQVLPDLRALDCAMIADLADRLAADPFLEVEIHETDQGCLGIDVPGPAVRRVREPPGPLRVRVAAAVGSLYDHDEHVPCVLITGRNPLLPLEDVRRAVQLLAGEDDTVVFAAAEGGDDGELVLVAMRTHHPGLFAEEGCGGGVALRALMQAEALVIPLRPLRNIRGRDDLEYLHHEIERAMLLGRPYPDRTYKVLRQMIRKGIIPEPS